MTKTTSTLTQAANKNFMGLMQYTILQIIHDRPKATTLEISHFLNEIDLGKEISRPHISNVLKAMASDGWVTEGTRRSGKVGQPEKRYSITPLGREKVERMFVTLDRICRTAHSGARYTI